MSPPSAGFNPLDYPPCLATPRRVKAVAWHEHIPFAMALVRMLEPRLVVELGVHTGDSYLAFCQAVAEASIPARMFGIDTWQGDPHSGVYGDAVLRELRDYHDPLYGTFSTLLETSFDDAAATFADGSIDLLHIDGYHTYDAVAHDWNTWRSKVSRSGIVLFHDTNVRERDFGVWRLWSELSTQYPSFEFTHGHGLGVLAAGSDAARRLRPLLDLDEEGRALVRRLFFLLGSRLSLTAERDQNSRQVAEYDRALRLANAAKADLQTQRETLATRCESLSEALHASRDEHSALMRAQQEAQTALATAQLRLRDREVEQARLQATIDGLSRELTQSRLWIDSVSASRSYRYSLGLARRLRRLLAR